MLIIFYCWYESCDWSSQAAETARGLGYTNVVVYSGGIEAWQNQGETVARETPRQTPAKKAGKNYQVPIDIPSDNIINLTTLSNLMENHTGEFVLFDARGSDSYQEAHIPTALSLPYDRVYEEAQLLPSNKDMLIVFYCQHETCGLSPQAAEKARALGYNHVVVYLAGIDDWKKAGYPTE